MNQSISSKSVNKTKIKMRLTKYGWILAFLLVWLPLSAIGTANNFLVIVFTLGLGLAIVSGRMGKKNIRNLELTDGFPTRFMRKRLFSLNIL